MRKNLVFLALATIGLASCNGGFNKGEGGLLYKIVNDKSGPTIKEGDFATINYVIKNDADSVMQSSYESGQPQPLIMRKPQFKGDVMAAIAMLSEGDSAIVKINIDSASKGRPKPPGLKGKYVVYNIKVEKVMAKGKLTDQVFQANIASYMQSLAATLKTKEPVSIKKYIDDNKLNVTKTDSGLYYSITTPGSGPLPVAGDTVVVNYTGKMLSGKIFDTNVKAEAIKAKIANTPRPYEPIRFPIGQKRVIPGWDQGLALLNKGAKAIFVIPSKLAYGEQGNGPIAPFTPLVFEVELVNIIHPNPNAPKPVMPTMAMPTQQPAK